MTAPDARGRSRFARELMGFNCGIVGLPNVGKSTLFNALTATAVAEAANYPFCTIEPNVGRVAVPDERLAVCAQLAGSPARFTGFAVADGEADPLHRQCR